MQSSQSTRSMSPPALPLRVGAFLVGLAFLVLAVLDSFIPHEPLSLVQALARAFFLANGLVLVFAAASPFPWSVRLLRPALFTAFAFLGIVALGLARLLFLSLRGSDGMAPFLLGLLAPTALVGTFAFLVWRKLRPSAA